MSYSRLSLSVLQDYTKLRPDVHVKNITAWTPVVVEILDGLGRFDDNAVGTIFFFQIAFVYHPVLVLHVSPGYLPAGHRTPGQGSGSRDSCWAQDIL
jgi:hypothetical protein